MGQHVEDQGVYPSIKPWNIYIHYPLQNTSTYKIRIRQNLVIYVNFKVRCVYIYAKKSYVKRVAEVYKSYLHPPSPPQKKTIVTFISKEYKVSMVTR